MLQRTVCLIKELISPCMEKIAGWPSAFVFTTNSGPVVKYLVANNTQLLQIFIEKAMYFYTVDYIFVQGNLCFGLSYISGWKEYYWSRKFEGNNGIVRCKEQGPLQKSNESKQCLIQKDMSLSFNQSKELVNYHLKTKL